MDAGASLHTFMYISPVPTSKSIHLIIHLVIIGQTLSQHLLCTRHCSSSGNKAENKAQPSPPSVQGMVCAHKRVCTCAVLMHMHMATCVYALSRGGWYPPLTWPERRRSFSPSPTPCLDQLTGGGGDTRYQVTSSRDIVPSWSQQPGSAEVTPPCFLG